MIENDTLITDLIKFELNVMSELVLISWNKLILLQLFSIRLIRGFPILDKIQAKNYYFDLYTDRLIRGYIRYLLQTGDSKKKIYMIDLNFELYGTSLYGWFPSADCVFYFKNRSKD